MTKYPRPNTGREPPFTSVKPGFMHTIDYCFYTDFSVRQQRAAAAASGGGGGGGDGGSQLAVRGVCPRRPGAVKRP